ncbi:MAG: multicopper oxidase domain-containing protein [Mariprofundus sp.]|nr:multicopper oxidase domain-containing protein [Mariprofundus sp.]
MAAITDVIHPFKTTLIEPKLLDLRSKSRKKIYIKSAIATIYDDGINSIDIPVWGYAKRRNGKAKYLGPSIITSKDRTVDITWINALKGDDPAINQKADRLLFPAIASNYTENIGAAIPQNRIGVEADAEPTMGHHCQARFSTHLHGGKVATGSDGMPESMIMPGQRELCRYENKQRATMLWYHDHAMHTTRLHAYAGMAGAWIITDNEEAKLSLPTKGLALVVQDRNLTISNDGTTNPGAHKTPDEIDADSSILFNNSNVQLLHKVESGDGPLEFAGPLTLVNGKIWPVTDVDGDWYRLRILNGANSRTYSLLFAERTGDAINGYTYSDVHVNTQQIGSDGGLFAAPVQLTENLILAPAERADLLVNFAPLAGKDIVVLNAAEAPFANAARQPFTPALGGATPPTIDVFKRLNDGDYGNGPNGSPELCEDRTPYPEVMMFSVRAAIPEPDGSLPPAPYSFPLLATRFAALKATGNSSFDIEKPDITTQTRTIAIVEKNMIFTMPNGDVVDNTVLVLWELQTADELANQSSAILETTQTVSVDGQTYYVVAERFQDPVSFIVKYGTSERWRFINLTADTHPMHMHLVQFIAVSRRLITEVNNQKSELNDKGELPILDLTTQAIADGTTVTIMTNADEVAGTGLDENEKGLKDTIRVNPGEMVEVEAKFNGYCGRYVYHCHLLEHEDHDMMRQFIVTRDDLGHHGMPDISVRKN